MDKVLTVVHVEENLLSHRLLSDILSRNQRFTLIAHVTTGKDALRICHETQPDFIIVAFGPIDMSLLDCVTQLMELCPTSAIITTSLTNPADYEQEMLLAGVRYFLSEPFYEDHVIDSLISIEKQRRRSLE